MQNLSGIKNIIFDLGNVLIPLQMKRAGEAFQELMDNGMTTDAFIEHTREAFRAYETGKISTSDFLNVVREYLIPETRDEQIVEAWNMVLGDFPPAHAGMLKKLKPHFRLFVLSNTNELHTHKFEKAVPGAAHLEEFFEKLYYSHIEGLRKPQPELYQRVIEQNQLLPSETLFADDLEENLEPARRLGIKTLHVTPEIDLYAWFTR
ncbi:MAG: HAD family phosphatase [Marinilabilia sp.]